MVNDKNGSKIFFPFQDFSGLFRTFQDFSGLFRTKNVILVEFVIYLPLAHAVCVCYKSLYVYMSLSSVFMV